MHNYALMIFDKKKQGFRLVPVDSHIEFEKKKSERQEVDPIDKSSPTTKEVPVAAPLKEGEEKKEGEDEEKVVLSGLNKFKTAFKRRINQTNRALLPTKQKIEKEKTNKRSSKGEKGRKEGQDELEPDFEENFSNNDDKLGSENEKSPEFDHEPEGFEKDSDNLSQFSDTAK